MTALRLEARPSRPAGDAPAFVAHDPAFAQVFASVKDDFDPTTPAARKAWKARNARLAHATA
jgi:hypothetical protein